MRKGTVKFIRHATGFLCLLLLILLLFCTLLSALEAHHDFCGENCWVCACIRLCERLLDSLLGGALLRLIGTISVLAVLFRAADSALQAPCVTPISQKIRLNN